MPPTRPLTLAYIVNLYPPYVVGGNELLAQQVIAALRTRGHTVHVLTGRGRNLPDDGYTHQALDIDLDQKEAIFLGGLPLTLRRLVDWHLYNGRSAQGVHAALAAIRPDVTIAWNLYMASAAPLAAARRAARPVIAHPADKWLLYMADDIRTLVPATTWANRLALDAIHALVQPALKRMSKPDYILAVSEFIRGLHTAAGYAPAQSRATWLGIEPAQFPFSPHAHPGRERPWRLMFAGQLWAGKGPQVAVQAVRRLRDTPGAPPFTLDVYGGGAANFVDHLRRTADELGVADAVTLHGFVQQAQLAQEFRTHDAYLFCSIWDEPFSGGLLRRWRRASPRLPPPRAARRRPCATAKTACSSRRTTPARWRARCCGWWATPRSTRNWARRRRRRLPRAGPSPPTLTGSNGSTPPLPLTARSTRRSTSPRSTWTPIPAQALRCHERIPAGPRRRGAPRLRPARRSRDGGAAALHRGRLAAAGAGARGHV